MASFDYIRDMPTLRIVVTENCELCEKGLNNLSFLNNFFTIKKVDVQEGYEEFLLRVPVVLYRKKVLDEGILSKYIILRNFIKYRFFKLFCVSIGFDLSVFSTFFSRKEIISFATSTSEADSIPSNPGEEFTSKTKGPLLD